MSHIRSILLKVLVLVTVVIQALNISAEDYSVSESLSLLDKAVANRRSFFQKKEWQIDSMKDVLLSVNRISSIQRMLNYETIGDAYSTLNNDSASVYYQMGLDTAIELDNDSMANVYRLKLAFHAAVGGMTQNAVQIMESVDTVNMGDDVRYLFHKMSRGVCYYGAMVFEHNYDLHRHWYDRSVKEQRFLLQTQKYYTRQYNKDLADYYYLIQQFDKGEKLLNELLGDKSIDSLEYAQLMMSLGLNYEAIGDSDRAVYCLAEAARYFIYAGSGEVIPLQHLAEKMYRDNEDIIRAYEYTMTALESASECGAVARVMQISPQLSIVSNARGKLITWWTRAYSIILAIVVFSALIIIVIAYLLYRHIKKMNGMQKVLVEANHAREVYIGQFMMLCSVYMDKLHQFNGLVNRKLSLGQTEELFKLTKSGKLLEEQTKDFYNVFDSAFLHLYPNFVSDVNALFHPEDQIVLKEGELLNTDLRILACLRLGLDDANRIAQVLNYSVNTIYSYRNRLRNRAIKRETFEIDLMSL